MAMATPTPLIFAVGLGLGLVQSTPRLVGRWDLTFTDRGEVFPSWLEVTKDQGSIKGRFQGRGGHASPVADVVVTGNRFRFLWPSDDDPKAAPTVFEGTIGLQDAMTGTMIEPSSQRIRFRGTRAPALDRPAPRGWEAPIDLLATGLAGWLVRPAGGANGWTFQQGELINAPPSGNLVTRQRFTDFKLHLEVNVPPQGNSGIYLRGRHEVQVTDDFGKEPHSRLMGGIYGQVTPTTLPAKPAGAWQTFDVTLIGRRVTVVLNGVTMIDDQEIPGITGGALDSDEAAPGPLMLQGDHSGVRYRRITIQPAAR